MREVLLNSERPLVVVIIDRLLFVGLTVIVVAVTCGVPVMLAVSIVGLGASIMRSAWSLLLTVPLMFAVGIPGGLLAFYGCMPPACFVWEHWVRWSERFDPPHIAAVREHVRARAGGDEGWGLNGRSARTIADEPARWVVVVPRTFIDGRSHLYYAVDKGTGDVTVIGDTLPYRRHPWGRQRLTREGAVETALEFARDREPTGAMQVDLSFSHASYGRGVWRVWFGPGVPSPWVEIEAATGAVLNQWGVDPNQPRSGGAR